jgi:hypothetical protein
MEDRLVEEKYYVEYSDPVEPEFPSEHENELHLEILEEPIDESVTDLDETMVIDFEVDEYIYIYIIQIPILVPKNQSPSKNIFDSYDDLEKNNEADSLTILVPTSQPSDDLIQDNWKMKENFVFSIPYHYEQWLAFHDDNHIKKFIKFCKIFQTLKFG